MRTLERCDDYIYHYDDTVLNGSIYDYKTRLEEMHWP